MAENLPVEIEDPCQIFHENLFAVEESVKVLTESNIQDIDLGDLEDAHLKLTSCYCLTALFWTYLIVQGIPTQEHPISKELSRIQKLMQRLQEQLSRRTAPRLNKRAAKSFVRNALWHPEQATADAPSSKKSKV